MTGRTATCLFVLALLGGTIPSGASASPDRVAGELLVRFSGPQGAERAGLLLNTLGEWSPGRAGGIGRLRLDPAIPADGVLEQLRDLEGVEIAQPNYRYRFTARPDDPLLDQQWAVDNRGQEIFPIPPATTVYGINNPGTPGADLGLEAAWDVLSDCRGVVVAVIDSGVDYTHADLAGAMWDGAPTFPNHGWDTADDDDDPLPDLAVPEDDHGTHVAAIVGAVGDNALGTSGVCQRAEIMALRAGSFAGGLTTLDVIEAIGFAVDHGASILNMSFGGEFPFDALFSQAIDTARAAGVLVITTAGNDGVDVDGPGTDGLATTRFYPCAFPQDNVVCIAASDQAHERALFSSFGATSVDAAAPGTNILSATYADGYEVKSGTSMAAPQASGIAALVWAHNPAYDYRDVRGALLASGTDAGAWAGLTVTGRVVHGDGAVRHLRPPTGLRFRLD
ncbi:MAG: S8 family serine peptidase [Gammaproteobacteria bacterium]|nr:S8 family serine peptidase [Gammaproteobacteria bacterium]